MLWLWILLGILGFLILLFFIGLYVVYRSTYYTPVKGQNNDFVFTPDTEKYCDMDEVKMMVKRMVDYPYESINTLSFDKHKLVARLYRQNSNTVVIMFHGYRGTPCRDFSGGAYDMIQRGYNVILVSERGHYGSEGHSITFGVREQKDVKSWIDYALREFGEHIRIVLVGISMGGATVLMGSNQLREGDLVIADCPYSTPKEVISSTLKVFLKLNPKIFYPVANLALLVFGHTNLNNCDANINVANSKAKFLIIHGEIDTLVPYQFSKRVAESNPEKVQYELFPNAEHGISYMIDKKRYQKLVTDFLENE